MVVEEVPKTTMRCITSSEVPEGHVWESFLQTVDGPDLSSAYVKLNDGSFVHMACTSTSFSRALWSMILRSSCEG